MFEIVDASLDHLVLLAFVPIRRVTLLQIPKSLEAVGPEEQRRVRYS